MPRRKGISDEHRSQLDRISESLARLSKEVKTTEHPVILETIADDLEHVLKQLTDLASFEINVPVRRSTPKPKPAPQVGGSGHIAPPVEAANLPPAPVRATATSGWPKPKGR